MNRFAYVTIAFASLALVGFAAPRAAAIEHPRLHAALHELRQTRADLKEAKHDFGGHRAKALAAVNEAILQIEKALRAVGDNVKGIEPAREVYRQYANHPHIRHALVESREARTELREASHNYKGHREKAVMALDEVINQLELALRYAR